MFHFKYLIFLTVLLSLSCNCGKSKEKPADAEYKTPCNTKFPYGDEGQINVNKLDGDANNVHCADQKDMKELEGKCPLVQSTSAAADPYVRCPIYDVVPPPHEIIFSSNLQPAPEVQCKKCDLKLTPDNTAVIVECYQCYDVPSPNRPANRTVRNILYKAFFIQISNYTSVDVTGREYLE